MPINFAVKLVATVAIEAVQMGLQASRHTYGPRLSETQVMTAEFGTPLIAFLGERRLTGQVVWSKDLEVVEHTSKIKGGGKQTTESALWTAGVALSDCRGSIGPLDKILKIWLDETLAYDATGSGPVSYASSLGIDLASVMRIYLGTEDQMPDPAYVDYCEAKYGPDSAPAFRGMSMIVFDKLPCDNFGNRPPQVSVLAVSAASDIYPYEVLAGGIDMKGASFSPDRTKVVIQGGVVAQEWDVPTLKLLGQISTHNFGGVHVALQDNATYYASSGATDGVYLVDEGGNQTKIFNDVVTGGLWNSSIGLVGKHSGISNNVLLVGDPIISLPIGFSPSIYVNDASGDTWASGGISSGGAYTSGFGLYNLRTETETLFPGLTTSGEAFAVFNSDGDVFVWQQDHAYIVDVGSMTITLGPVATPSWAGHDNSPFIDFPAGRSTIWLGFTEISTTDLSTIKSYSYVRRKGDARQRASLSQSTATRRLADA
jgi:hypothetical protein